MKNYLNTSLFVLVCFALCGCETIYNTTNRNSIRSRQDEAAIRKELQFQQTQLDAQSARRSVESMESHIGQLEARILNVESASVSTSWATRDDVAALQQQIDELRAALEASQAQHEQLRKDIIANVKTLLQEQEKRRPAARTQSAGAYYEHKVESGQTLSEIAKAYGVSVNTIKEANKIKGDTIRVGQILRIPD